MKISRDGVLPQLELGPRVGGLKVLYQRAGSIVFQPITMLGAMLSAWSTTAQLRAVFLDSLLLYFGSVVLIGIIAMGAYYSFILPSEQAFNQGQAQRAERSPLKRDTEEIKARLDAHNIGEQSSGRPTIADGGEEGEA